jgi:hypothetical protein
MSVQIDILEFGVSSLRLIHCASTKNSKKHGKISKNLDIRVFVIVAEENEGMTG